MDARLAPLLDRTVLDPDSGCLVWTGATNDRGYPQVRRGGRTVYVHRLVCEIAHGPIPDGHQVDHVRDAGCTHVACILPTHLEAVTQQENIARSDGVQAVHARKTVCTRGHSLGPDGDVYVTKAGSRQCRICKRLRRCGRGG